MGGRRVRSAGWEDSGGGRDPSGLAAPTLKVETTRLEAGRARTLAWQVAPGLQGDLCVVPPISWSQQSIWPQAGSIPLDSIGQGCSDAIASAGSALPSTRPSTAIEISKRVKVLIR